MSTNLSIQSISQLYSYIDTDSSTLKPIPEVNLFILTDPRILHAIESIEDEIYLATGKHTGEYTRSILEKILLDLLHAES